MDPLAFLSNFTQTLTNLGSHGPLYAAWFFLSNGGWVLIILISWPFIKDTWLNWRQNIYAPSIKWICLAVNVPKNNEQSPKAVEQIFNQLWAYRSNPNLLEKWWKGVFVPTMSLEIVSIEGYIQFIVRAPLIFRDLVEAAFYAQYPEAELTEIEDYTADFTPENFREKGYKMWGAQFELTNKDFFPIRTYPLFEHTISQKIIDPLSAMLEMMSQLDKGEQLWYQIVIMPETENWKKEADILVKTLIGVEVKKDKPKIDQLLEQVYTIFGFMFPGFEPEKKKESQFPSKVLYMSKGELEDVHSIEIKASKTGFRTKMRMIYWGKKDIFSKTKGVAPFVGALKQYSSSNLNGFKPAGDTATKADYWHVEQRIYERQRKILNAYKERSLHKGVNIKGYILNVEELASLYHFPTIEVSTTSIRTAESKKSPAPTDIPEEIFEQIAEPEVEKTPSFIHKEKSGGVTEAPPINLPT